MKVKPCGHLEASVPGNLWSVCEKHKQVLLNLSHTKIKQKLAQHPRGIKNITVHLSNNFDFVKVE
jgi:hypothetical protein